MNANSVPKIFVVVLNFNGKDIINTCLSSIFQSDYLNFEVVVVDNCSQDGSFEQARSSFSRAHFIKNPNNLGFAQGNNIGIRYALEKFADYIFILNNDTTIENSTISSLVCTMKNNPAAGIASPIIFNADNSVWFAGGNINWKKMRTEHLRIIKQDSPYATEYISGCSMFIKKEVFKETGLFDERFFLYYEDADFSWRSKKYGFDIIMDPTAHIIHFERSTSLNKLKNYWLVLSGLLFFRIHSSFLNKLWIILIYLPLRKAKNFYDLFLGNNPTAHDTRKAYKDFRKNFKL